MNQNLKMMMINNKEKNQNNKNDKAKNVDDILAKIRERKKIEVVNDIKKQLFPNSLNNNKNIEEEEKLDEKSIKNLNNINSNLKGFIQINANFKNLNSLMLVLKNFFKNEGFKITKRDLLNSQLGISNGEIDVILYFEKMHRIIKISFVVVNGNKDDLVNFKKIMKKFSIKEG